MVIHLRKTIFKIRITGASNNKEMINANTNDRTAFPRKVVIYERETIVIVGVVSSEDFQNLLSLGVSWK